MVELYLSGRLMLDELVTEERRWRGSGHRGGHGGRQLARVSSPSDRWGGPASCEVRPCYSRPPYDGASDRGGVRRPLCELLRAAARSTPTWRRTSSRPPGRPPAEADLRPVGRGRRRRGRAVRARRGQGRVVCLLLPWSIDYAVCYQAAARLGAITTGVNLRLAGARPSIPARTRPAVTVVEDGADDAVGPGRRRCSSGRRATRPPTAAASPFPDAAPADPVAIVWTSGSTGLPKGALFDHRNLAAVAAGTDVLSQPGDRRLSPLPFAHVGYMTRPWDEIAHGVTTVITPSPWRAADAIALLAGERVTVGQGVPTQWALVLAHPDLEAADVSPCASPAPAPPGSHPSWSGHARAAGCPGGGPLHLDRGSLGTGTGRRSRRGGGHHRGAPGAGVELALVDEDGGRGGRRRGRTGAPALGRGDPRLLSGDRPRGRRVVTTPRPPGRCWTRTAG